MYTIQKIIICVFITINCFGSPQNLTRNMLILLDEEGKYENIGNSIRHYLSCKFQSALEEAVCPILISSTLVQGFIEKREAMKQMSLVHDTSEHMIFTVYIDINKKMNEVYDFYQNEGLDHIHCKQMMLAKTNEAFYKNAAMHRALERGTKFPSDEALQLLRTYLTSYDSDAWDIYTNKSLYLFK